MRAVGRTRTFFPSRAPKDARIHRRHPYQLWKENRKTVACTNIHATRRILSPVLHSLVRRAAAAASASKGVAVSTRLLLALIEGDDISACGSISFEINASAPE